MFRKPVFWVGLILFSCVCLLFTFVYFSDAFPIVSVDLRMDRTEALASAAEIATRSGIGPREFRQAASFGVDQNVQNFVELEAGGTAAFRGLIESGLYSPFSWRVRHFVEGDTHEASFWFTPEGRAYGFSEHLAEDAPGAALDAAAALQLVTSAAPEWTVELAAFQLVEQSQEVKPGGRVDHTVVYERSDKSIGEARYRLRFMVSGDRVTAVRHFVKIPESFSRKYEEMRSSNEVISFGAAIAVGVVYLLGGCGFGLFFLLRSRWALWRPALIWGGLIGFLQFLAQLNGLPLSWMGYDTAVGAEGFLLREVVQALGGALAMGAILTVSFAVAEGLGRKAFPQHLQLWKHWAQGIGNSSRVAGMTLGGLLLVPVFFAYDVALYSFSTDVLGWWSPSDALIQPDTLATYFPWLNSIAISAQAGFWEEALFRAVPLAGAALLGQRFGGRKYWIGFALIVQALVFGAGHANYPAQPAYARLVELILPALGFGVIYLRFGLLPGVILHFVFDVCWFAIPVFVSTASGIWMDQALILVLALLPLWVVLWCRYRGRTWAGDPAGAFNRDWIPESPPAPAPFPVSAPAATPIPAGRTRVLALSALVIGLLLWLVFSPFSTDTPGLSVSRSEALEAARSHLASRQVQLGPEWKELASVEAPNNENDRFVWQEGGSELYGRLLGSYLGGPYWEIRYVRFDGDVAARAEEYQVHIGSDGKPFRFLHRLPESSTGAQLEREPALALAEAALQQEFGMDRTSLREVSAEPSQLPNRRDWVFTFSDPGAFPLPKGEARVSVAVSGDQVADAFRWVFVPEDWLRDERNARNVLGILTGICAAVLSVLVLAGAIWGIVQWSRRRFSASGFVQLALFLGVISLLEVANSWPSLEARFTTAQPYTTQVLVALLGMSFAGLIGAVLVSLVYGVWRKWVEESDAGPGSAWQGLALGLLAVGVLAVADQLLPQRAPYWPDLSGAGSAVPGLAVLSGALMQFVRRSVTLVFLFCVLQRIERGGRARKIVVLALLLAFSIATAGSRGPMDYSSWLASAAGYSVVFLFMYWVLFRFAPQAAMPSVAASVLLSLVQTARIGAFPGVAGWALLAAVAVFGLMWAWNALILKKAKGNSTESVEMV